MSGLLLSRCLWLYLLKFTIFPFFSFTHPVPSSVFFTLPYLENPLIYFFEKVARYFEKAAQYFEKVAQKVATIVFT